MIRLMNSKHLHQSNVNNCVGITDIVVFEVAHGWGHCIGLTPCKIREYFPGNYRQNSAGQPLLTVITRHWPDIVVKPL
jgi:hypothetical protein